MQDQDMSTLLRDESFLNYCFSRNIEDVRQWKQWLQQHPQHREKVEEVKKLAILLAEEAHLREEDLQYGLLRQQIVDREKWTIMRIPHLSPFLRMGIAASLFAICTFAIYTVINKTTDKAGQQQLGTNIIPGGNKAVLTLADGSRITLDDTADGDIAQQAGTTITKTTDGQIIYEVSSLPNSGERSGMNTIETPNGGQYQVRLPDGTAVWLNAISSLTYPTSFASGKERRVRLSGEAYFEVAKDKNRPFIVSSEGQNVEVLGTHFNINAYPDEGQIKTTLIEGSVKVTSMSKASASAPLERAGVKIKPGEQAVNMDGKLNIATVNAVYAIAWKDGYFRFNDKTLDEGMKEIARWYNVHVRYDNPQLKAELLAGTISKYSDIQQVLRKMELTGAFRFTIKGREIFIE